MILVKRVAVLLILLVECRCSMYGKTLDSKFESLKRDEKSQRLIDSGLLTTSIGQETVSTVTVRVGERAYLPCRVHHLGTQSVFWRRGNAMVSIDETAVTRDNRITVSSQDDIWRLIIERVKPEDAGEYICSVTSTPPTERTLTLRVVMREELNANEDINSQLWQIRFNLSSVWQELTSIKRMMAPLLGDQDSIENEIYFPDVSSVVSGVNAIHFAEQRRENDSIRLRPQAICNVTPNVQFPNSRINGTVSIIQNQNLRFDINMENVNHRGNAIEALDVSVHTHGGSDCRRTGEILSDSRVTQRELTIQGKRFFGSLGRIQVPASGRITNHLIDEQLMTIQDIIGRSIVFSTNINGFHRRKRHRRRQVKMACCQVYLQ